MNRTVLSIVIVAVVAIALGTAGFVYAQSPATQTPVPGTGYGYGRMGSRGGMMGANPAGTQDGVLHDGMMAVFSEKLGISVADLNSAITKGETMAQIASSKGLTADQFQTLMTDARNQAIDQALKNGTLTQDQANWMKQHGAGQAMSNGRGMRGSGLNRNANPNCPYNSQTQP